MNATPVGRGTLVALAVAVSGLGVRELHGRIMYDAAPGLADLERLEHYLATSYANLDWKIAQREVDPAKLHREAVEAMEKTRTQRAARKVIQDFLAAFHDGHVRATNWSPPSARVAALPTAPAHDISAGSEAACRTMGYGNGKRRGGLLSQAPRWQKLDIGDARLPFDRGEIRTSRHRVGVIRIHAFGYEPHSWACIQVLETWRAQTGLDTCDAACGRVVRRGVADSLTSALQATVSAFVDAGHDALVFDLTGNGGGTEWVSQATRVVVPQIIRGIAVGFVRGEHHRPVLEQQWRWVDSASAAAPAGEWADSLAAAKMRLATGLAEIAVQCDRSVIWQGETPQCSGLTNGGFTTGVFSALPESILEKQSDLRTVFTVPGGRRSGRWAAGPLILVVDGETASASEEFVATLADQAGAVVLGERTYGSGCGHTRGGLRVVLEAVRLEVRAPDCARFRADGSNEVAGVSPTHPVHWERGDGTGDRAAKVVAAIDRLGSGSAMRQ